MGFVELYVLIRIYKEFPKNKPEIHPYIFSDNDFWFPVNSSAPDSVPPCARGHTATYDPDSKAVFVYGGLREGQRCSELYILNTLTWKWKLVTVGLLEVANLAYYLF